jgi:molecular chaperone GrpE
LSVDAIEAVLADFRSWLQQVPALSEDGQSEKEADEPIDLHTLLGQFVALRHEVHLQTRATRAQQEQNGETLRQLGLALDQLRQATASPRQPIETAVDDRIRPLLKTLLDVGDASRLAEREVQKIQQTIRPAVQRWLELAESNGAEGTVAEEPLTTGAQSLWSRWFGGRRPPAATGDRRSQPGKENREAEAPDRQREARESIEFIERVLDSVLTGYKMSSQRVERTLEQAGLLAIPCVGRAFDPEKMEVLEVVSDSGRPAYEVVEEVRTGYTWQGRVFRYAQVRVAKP